MTSRAKLLFDSHLQECREVITLYEHFEKTSIYRADFNLRFVWIAAVSALISTYTQLILELAKDRRTPIKEYSLRSSLSDGVLLSKRTGIKAMLTPSTRF